MDSVNVREYIETVHYVRSHEFASSRREQVESLGIENIRETRRNLIRFKCSARVHHNKLWGWEDVKRLIACTLLVEGVNKLLQK